VTRAALLASILALAGAAPAAAESRPTTPIQHFVVLMQENHSFDNYFGTYPGADGIPKGACMPVGKRPRPCVRPFRLGGRPVPDLGHDRRIHQIQYARGRMDGFVRAASIDRQTVDRSVMGYYDDRDLPFYWNVADEYVLFDRFFAATTEGSVASHMFWVTGTPGNPDGGFGDRATIFDRLDRRGISWKFYVEDYDPRQPTQAVRVPLLNSDRYVRDPKLFGHIVDLDEYYEDLRDGKLPQVAYIAPAGSSEHPPGRIGAGEALVKRLITALSMSSAWDTSAFMWTYDEWGGWFDHVRPPRVAAGTLGFRVPALLVSPYARRGYVDSTPLDTTSILRFIEDNWKLEPLATRDARANSLAGAFDFSKAPRAPSIVAAERGPEDPTAVRRWVIYLGYGAALILSGLLIGWGVLRPAAAVLVLAIAVLLTLNTDAADAQTPRGGPIPPTIRTVPAAPGMRFALGRHRFEADRAGRATPPTALRRAGASLRALDTEIAPGVRAKFDRWYSGRRIAALTLYHRVGISFVDLDANAVAPSAVTSVTLQGSDGSRHVLTGARQVWLQGNRVVPESQGRTSTRLYYSADKVLVAGSNVVHRGQQRFFPAASPKIQLRLLLFAVRVTVRDALLGFPIGSAVRLQYPNGSQQREALGSSGDLTVEKLPRGDYRVSVDALGISSSRPIALSRNQEVNVRVISWLDVAVVLLVLGSLALALLFVRRPAPAGRRQAAGVVASVLVAVAIVAAAAPPARAAGPPDPLFAYYYIWFNAGSWNRAKIDYPLLGRYSSDEREVMRTHVEWAKRAGIDGFIVSWKSTPVLNRRLRRLAEVAEAERFKLLVIYQGLDFEREPLPAARVAHDLDVFEHRFAQRRPFQVFAKPLVIWSGTPRFTRAQLASVTERARRKLLVLASERNVAGYRRVAGVVDGNAYYWGSVDPATYPGYAEKLATMGDAIHSRGGLWIAPAAPGFDARLVGGRSVVDRRDGATLRTQLDAATGSSPDAIGLISWNEFSENTHVEPSQRYGSRYLDVVADVRGARLPQARDFDSSEPAATGVNYGLPLLGGVALFFVGGFLVLLRRSQRRLPPAPPGLTRRGYGGPH
jgi:phospholipase C